MRGLLCSLTLLSIYSTFIPILKIKMKLHCVNPHIDIIMVFKTNAIDGNTSIIDSKKRKVIIEEEKAESSARKFINIFLST